MLILVAPALFAASIYMTLGRIIIKLDAQNESLIPVRFLTKIFVVGDVISFLLQCGGMLQNPLSLYTCLFLSLDSNYNQVVAIWLLGVCLP